jgi:predicted DsbA family dithiol-disulfide isomerase
MSEGDLTAYFKRFIVKNPAVEVVGSEIIEKKKIDTAKGWELYLANMKIKVTRKTKDGKEDIKEMDIPQMVFVNGDLITPVLMNKDTKKNYVNEYKPSLKDSFYRDDHLLFGNRDAKHKIVVFSDPQCPFCMEIMPEIMDAVKKYPKTFALYYYHMPLLRIHPVSGILAPVMHIAQKKGRADVVYKLYSLEIDPREVDIDKVLKAVEKHSGFKVTKEELRAKEVKEAMIADEKAGASVMVTGTPTIYIDGKWDKMRNKYKKYLP